jgi:hypothetical protein
MNTTESASRHRPLIRWHGICFAAMLVVAGLIGAILPSELVWAADATAATPTEAVREIARAIHNRDVTAASERFRLGEYRSDEVAKAWAELMIAVEDAWTSASKYFGQEVTRQHKPFSIPNERGEIVLDDERWQPQGAVWVYGDPLAGVPNMRRIDGQWFATFGTIEKPKERFVDNLIERMTSHAQRLQDVSKRVVRGEYSSFTEFRVAAMPGRQRMEPSTTRTSMVASQPVPATEPATRTAEMSKPVTVVSKNVPKLEIKAVSTAEICIAWGSSAGATEYRVYRSDREKDFPLDFAHAVMVLDPDELEYRDSPVTRGTIYHYVVTAFGRDGRESVAGIGSAKPLDQDTPLRAEP